MPPLIHDVEAFGLGMHSDIKVFAGVTNPILALDVDLLPRCSFPDCAEQQQDAETSNKHAHEEHALAKSTEFCGDP
jgi:hypothetical protein